MALPKKVNKAIGVGLFLVGLVAIFSQTGASDGIINLGIFAILIGLIWTIIS